MSADTLGTLRIDADRCEGHGRCYALSPELFEPDDVGTGLVSRSAIGSDDLEAAERAVAACPERAVVLELHH